MFSSPALYTQAIRDLYDTHAGYYARALQTVMEAGETAMEHHVDALRTLFATTTVTTRQWSSECRRRPRLDDPGQARCSALCTGP